MWSGFSETFSDLTSLARMFKWMFPLMQLMTVPQRDGPCLYQSLSDHPWLSWADMCTKDAVKQELMLGYNSC